MEFIIFSSDARGLHRRVVSGTGERAKVAVNDLSDFVESPACALDLKLRPDLQLWLLLLHVHQVPLVLQSSLTSFPELQEQSNCQVVLTKRKMSSLTRQIIPELQISRKHCI